MGASRELHIFSFLTPNPRFTLFLCTRERLNTSRLALDDNSNQCPYAQGRLYLSFCIYEVEPLSPSFLIF